MGLEPTISRTTIWRANQLHHTHHIYYLLNYSVQLSTTLFNCVALTSLGGFEPSTYGLEGRCSIQLSYRLTNQLFGTAFSQIPAYDIKALRKRVMGIEPTYLAWKASVLPLNYTRISIGVTGFEPATSWSQTRRSSQAEPHPEIFFFCHMKSYIPLYRRDTRVIIYDGY